jgi:hypothetical protein
MKQQPSYSNVQRLGEVQLRKTLATAFLVASFWSVGARADIVDYTFTGTVNASLGNPGSTQDVGSTFGCSGDACTNNPYNGTPVVIFEQFNTALGIPAGPPNLGSFGDSTHEGPLVMGYIKINRTQLDISNFNRSSLSFETETPPPNNLITNGFIPNAVDYFLTYFQDTAAPFCINCTYSITNVSNPALDFGELSYGAPVNPAYGSATSLLFSFTSLQVTDLTLNPAPGPIPGVGLLSYLGIGLIGLGSYGWKRLRQAAN